MVSLPISQCKVDCWGSLGFQMQEILSLHSLIVIKGKDIPQEAVKKRRYATKKPYSRSIVGATLEVIQKKRSPEVCDAALLDQENKDEKKANKAEVMAKTSKTQGKTNISKGPIPKGPKLGGSGGKH
ncbi:hypothetical protein FNV43_RR00082 [Rhamnella rubrinervis]|uniref:Uncharacterized protein n=1 Tax=Rhamnella rubrinervis TaxID=2594499 RepID=A0A8K0HN06_9ROSA|nr:hypothetical protein FNV43_RR00082 [Rhamnella rubrinervis]